MTVHLSDFIAEQSKGLVDLMKNLRQSQVKAAREAARSSAARVKSLNQRVRTLAQSGLRLNEVSHGAAQDLIELQAEIVTSALTDASVQIERLSYTETARDFARMQGEVLHAARQRIVDDLARAVAALKGAAGEVRKAVVPREAAKPAKPAKPAKRRTTARARAKAPATVKAKAKGKTRVPARRAKRSTPRKTVRRTRRPRA